MVSYELSFQLEWYLIQEITENVPKQDSGKLKSLAFAHFIIRWGVIQIKNLKVTYWKSCFGVSSNGWNLSIGSISKCNGIMIRKQSGFLLF